PSACGPAHGKNHTLGKPTPQCHLHLHGRLLWRPPTPKPKRRDRSLVPTSLGPGGERHSRPQELCQSHTARPEEPHAKTGKGRHYPTVSGKWRSRNVETS